jgi:5-hydroxyisourate hydrolase
MSPITTHVLDTARGQPAAGLEITLEKKVDEAFVEIGKGQTNEDGRFPGLMKPGELEVAIYRITFQTGDWFKAQGIQGFYPFVPVIFEITAPEQHYHVPLLLSPFGFSTYRGS